ncbi:MAG: hypothetical protein J5865_04650 [Lachnospiraceae bacterium]|nr:hypothetical protein [Lachnospiraceae bacterium]
MSSKLKPKKNNKKNEMTAKRVKFWSIFLCAAVLVIATILILIRTGVFESDEVDPVGRYELTSMKDPSGAVMSADELAEATEMVEPGQPLIEIQLKADGTFSFDPNFDLMIHYEGKYELDGHAITMTDEEGISDPITGTIDSRYLTITDSEGYVMTFKKAD